MSIPKPSRICPNCGTTILTIHQKLCRPCKKIQQKQYNKEYREKNREHLSELGKAYYQRPEVRARIKRQAKKYRNIPENYIRLRKIRDENRRLKREKLNMGLLTEVKRCSKCSETKSLIEFPIEGTICKKCTYKKTNLYRREKIWKCKYSIEQQIKRQIKTRIRVALRRYNLKKKNTTLHYLGCDIISYIKFLKTQFSCEMTLENYGRIWHIDHIIPINLFDLIKQEEIMVAINYRNTRPMLVEENLKRSKTSILKQELNLVLGRGLKIPDYKLEELRKYIV